MSINQVVNSVFQHVQGFGQSIGIGTTVPLAMLHVYTSNASNTFASAGLVLQNAGTGDVGLAIRSGTTSSNSWGIGLDQNSSRLDFTYGTSSITPSEAKLSVTASGLVGIANTNPSFALDVTGYIRSSLGLRVGAVEVIDADGNFLARNLQMLDGAGNTALFVSESGFVGIATDNPLQTLHVAGTQFVSGNIGIGTTNPNHRMHIYSTSTTNNDYESAGIMLENASTGEAAIVIRAGAIPSTSNWFLGVNSNQTRLDIGYGFQATELEDAAADMTILANGNIGIGTTNPSHKLHVYSTSSTNNDYESAGILLENTTSNEVGVAFRTATMGSSNWVIGVNSNQTRLDIGYGLPANQIDDADADMSILANGNVGIGTTNPQRRLHVQGDIYFTGSLLQNNVPFSSGSTSQWTTSNNTVFINSNVGIGVEVPQSRLQVAGSILPGACNVYDLGSSNYRWRDLYLSGNTIDLEGSTITKNAAGGLSMNGPMLLGSGSNTRWASYYTTSNVGWTSSNLLTPVSDGRINGVNITALNSRTRASYAEASEAVSIWTHRNCAPNGWSRICWSAELSRFVVIAFNGTNRVMTSKDGIEWTDHDIGDNETNSWNGICWSRELSLLVAVASPGTSNVMTSYDGINWTARTSASESNDWFDVCWSPELSLFVAVAYSGTNNVMTSSDGKQWTGHNTNENETSNWTSVCWSPELSLFVAAAYSGTYTLMTSSNGVNWTGHNVGIGVLGVCWSPELSIFVAVGVDCCFTSSNGNEWISRNIGANQWSCVCWSPELSLFVAIAENGGSRRVTTSPDGIVWTPYDLGDLDSSGWYGICWSPELSIFVAVAYSGTIRVVTSKPVLPASKSAMIANPSHMHVDFATGNVGIGTTIPLSKLQVAGSILPGACNVYDLGSSNYRWRDLYLSGNTIDLEGSTITKNAAGGLSMNGPFVSTNIGIGTTTTTIDMYGSIGFMVKNTIVDAVSVPYDLRRIDSSSDGNTLALFYNGGGGNTFWVLSNQGTLWSSNPITLPPKTLEPYIYDVNWGGWGMPARGQISNDGNRIIVSPSMDDTGTGQVCIYHYFNNTWTLASNIEQQRSFGWGVAINGLGTRVAMTAPDNTNDENQMNGKLYLYDYNTSTSNWNLSFVRDYSRFPDQVTLSDDGNTLALSCTSNAGLWDLDDETNAKVYILSYSNQSWNLQQNDVEINAPSSVRHWHFWGKTIKLSGDGNTLAVGAPGFGSTWTYDGSYNSAVYVYKKTNDVWSTVPYKVQPISYFDPPLAATTNTYGNALDITYDGNTLVVGAPLESYYNDNNYHRIGNPGRVYIHTFKNNKWFYYGIYEGSNVSQYGIGVALSANRLYVATRANWLTPNVPLSTCNLYALERTNYGSMMNVTGNLYVNEKDSILQATSIYTDDFYVKKNMYVSSSNVHFNVVSTNVVKSKDIEFFPVPWKVTADGNMTFLYNNTTLFTFAMDGTVNTGTANSYGTNTTITRLIQMLSATPATFANAGGIFIEAGTTANGGNIGWKAINFNGFYGYAGEYRANTGKNRWRFVCDQRSSTDELFIDTWNGTTAKTILRMSTSGNVGVGTTDTSRTLTVHGDINFTGNLYQNNVQFVGGGGGSWSTSATNYTTGNVGIGTTNPTEKLQVVGNILASGDITAFSDIRLKTNLQKIESALDKVSRLTGYTYDLLQEEHKRRHTGLIAQDVEKVLPEAVYVQPDGLSLAYGNLLGLIVESIKEIKERLDRVGL